MRHPPKPLEILACSLLLTAASAYGGSGIEGTYRCWSYNVGGAGKRCSSPPLVLRGDETYSMSSEHGTYKVSGEKIVLSQSKIRGPRRFQENGRQIVFHYTYKGWEHTMTYLRQDSETPPRQSASENRGGGMVPVEVTLVFPASDGAVGWINTASLVPQDGSLQKERYDALARADGKLTIEASFRAVPAGRIYTLYVGSGFETRAVSTVDLRGAKGPVNMKVDVKPTAPSPSQ